MPIIKADNKRIAKNTAFLYLRMLFVLFVSLYTTRCVLQVLGVEDYGVYNVVGGFVSMFGFLNTSLTGAIQRFYNFEGSRNGEEGAARVYITSTVIQALLSIIILVALESFGVWYINNVMVVPAGRLAAAHWLFQFSALSMVLVIMRIPLSAAVMSFEKMDFYAVMGILDVLLRLAIVVVLPYLAYDKLIIYGLLVCLVSVFDFVICFIYVKKNFPFLRFRKNYDKSLFRPMLSFSGWNVLGTFAEMLKGQGLNMLLNAFFGTAVNAARGIAYQIMTALQSFSLNIVAAFRPQLVDSYAAGSYERTRNIMFAESKICYSLIYVISVPLVIELDYVLSLWLGSNVPEYTEQFTVIVLAIMTVSTLNTPLTQTVHASGKIRAYMIGTSIATCAIVPLAWIALKAGCGPLSVFLVSFAMTFVNQAVSLIIVHKVFQFSGMAYLRKVILPCAYITVLLPVIPLVLSRLIDESFVRLVIIVLIDVLWAMLIIYSLVLNKQERSTVRLFLQKKLVKK